MKENKGRGGGEVKLSANAKKPGEKKIERKKLRMKWAEEKNGKSESEWKTGKFKH